MKKTYYIQSFSKFTPILRKLNEEIENGDVAFNETTLKLFEALGFATYSDGSLSCPQIYSCYGVANIAKNLNLYNEFVEFIKHNTSFRISDFTESELEDAFRIVTTSNRPDRLGRFLDGVQFLEDLFD